MFRQINLPYSTNALEPIIDQATVELHYGKHHATYDINLEKSLQGQSEFLQMSLEQILFNYKKLPSEIQSAVFNNGGQVFNHNLYWQSLDSITAGQPSGILLEGINKNFGSFDIFKQELINMGISQFGSGWVWLSLDTDKKLIISRTANADSPLFYGQIPILTIDVWEHAYYLKYQNRRVEYLQNVFQIINWAEAERKYEQLINT